MQHRVTWLRTFFLTTLIGLSGCSITSHPVGPQAMGKPSSSAEMERLLDQPGPIELITISSAEWSASLGGLINLDHPAAIKEGLKERDEPIQIYAHWLKHPSRGNFLVDTGVSQELVDDPAQMGLNWMVRQAMHIDKIKIKTSTAEMMKAMNHALNGVFFTHLHLDHISGMPDIAPQVPLHIGPNESTQKDWINVFVQGATNQLLKDKHALQEWPFQPDPQQRFEGIVDVFEDGSVFAISVPGHTPGSTAYLIRTPQGPVLLTGDTSHTRWGWEHTVEPGDFTRDNERNLDSLKRLKDLVARHPNMEVRLGHQP